MIKFKIHKSHSLLTLVHLTVIAYFRPVGDDEKEARAGIQNVESGVERERCDMRCDK